MSVVGLDEVIAMAQQCWRQAKRLPQEERYDYMLECARQSLKASDVVERVYRQARSALGCPKPPLGELRAVVAYIVDRIVHTKGGLVTLSMRLIKPYLTKRHYALRCVVTWLGVEDCVYERKGGKVILSLSCVRQKLGLV